MESPGGLSNDILEVDLYNPRQFLLHGYIMPFIVLYSIWLGWINHIGFTDYFELGMITLAIIGVLQILTCLCCHWSVDIKCFMTCNKEPNLAEAQCAKITPPYNNGLKTIVNIEKMKDPISNTLVYYFYFQRIKYTLKKDKHLTFSPVQFPLDLEVSEYLKSRGYETEDALANAKLTFGINELHLNIPSFGELFKERATAPFFVFQVFCVTLWCMDGYWGYPLLTLFMLCAFEASLVHEQLRNLTTIRSMGAKPFNINVYRNLKWTKITSDQLIAGDIVSVSESNQNNLIPCDLLLLRGSCVIDESMLTGESVPVIKEACESLHPDEKFTFDEGHKALVLFGGTKVVQHTPPPKSPGILKSPDSGCVCYVLRTGLSTSQGRLLKTIMYSVKTVTANSLETFLFIAFLLVFAMIASAYVWIVGSADPRRNRYKLFLECTLILTSVIPQELPIELSLAVNSSLLALTKLLVYCTEPFRIPFAGKVDICAFDKTGTLTEDTVVVEGVTGLLQQPIFKLTSVRQCPLPTIQVLASCNSLVHTKNGLVGDPMEKAMLQSTGWSMSIDGTVHGHTAPRSQPLKIWQRFRFSSSLRRMSVVVSHSVHGGVEHTYLACVKGSPEALLPMLIDAPADYEDSYLAMARRGARVLALAQKPLGLLTHQQVRDLDRSEVESQLSFCGFVVISCPLKPDSKYVVEELQHSSHHVNMITGDNPLTACYVSNVLGIVRPDTPMLVLTPPNSLSQKWHWQSVDDSIVLPALEDENASPSSVGDLASQFDLCLTGEGIMAFSSLAPRHLQELVTKAKVFARVAPKQKEAILVQLKQLGYVTLMCGDGTNDVGALKQAHVGVALFNQADDLPKALNAPNSPAAAVNGNANSDAGKLGPRGAIRGRRGLRTGIESAKSGLERRMAETLAETEAEEEAAVVRLGDASIAAPFTVKMSSPTGVCQIIKQGRCTLVATLQMFKILAINSLISAYSFSVLSLKGFKTSDSQASIQALLLAASFLFISRSKPLKVLSRERPIPNIFNLYTLLTITVQFLIHFGALFALTEAAETRMPVLEDDFVDIHADFAPSILNTVVYLISTAMQAITILVNYKGRPFMESLIDNKPIAISLLIAAAGVCSLACGAYASELQLIPMDSDLRLLFFKIVALDLLGCWLFDRLLNFCLGRVHTKKL